MNNKTILTIAVVAIAIIAACKKDPAIPDNSTNTNTCVAGFGGDVTITAELQHHGATIVSTANYKDSVYIKFNSSDFPAGGLKAFDTVIVGKYGAGVHADHIHIHGLKCGKYYFYGTGFDTTINERVYGGLPYEIKQDTGEVDIIIPVTEGD